MRFLRSAFTGGLTAFLVACTASQQPVTPHIVVLIADDLGLDEAPCHGSVERMPYLQSRCETSLVFDRVYTHPYCTASRATLMTGRHPFRHGADDVRSEASKLPLSEVTIAELIKAESDAAYQTASFGKWHLADDQNGSERNPNLQGFDHFEGTPRQHHTYRYFDYDWFENGELVGRRDDYKTSLITEAVVEHFQAKAGEQPQFAIVGYTSPHKPYHAPPSDLHSFGELPPLNLKGTLNDNPGPGEYRANQREARFDPYYHAMLEALDTEIARLVGDLSAASERPILFIFLGDNGSAAEVVVQPESGRIRAKATLYEGGVRVPMMVWSSQPDVYPVAAGRSDRLIHLADLFSTLAEVAGVPAHVNDLAGPHIDGQSFARQLAANVVEQDRARQFAFLERGNDERLPFAFGAVDDQGLKLILRETQREVRYSRGNVIEIYDTSVDPLESDNLLTAPCTIPRQAVLDLFDFLVSKASQNMAHSDWFDPAVYEAELNQAFSMCEPSDDN